MSRWIRNRPQRWENTLAGLAATAAGVVVGAGIFYLTRLFLAREPLAEPETRVVAAGENGGAPRALPEG